MRGSQLLTHDARRYADEIVVARASARTGDGAGQLGLGRARLCLDALAGGPAVLARVRVPVLLLMCGYMTGWSVQARPCRAARHLPRAKLIRYGAEARHEMLREVDPVRDKVLADDRRLSGRCRPALRDERAWLTPAISRLSARASLGPRSRLKLAPQAAVTCSKRKTQPGYHATGRSAAFWTESYGGPGVLPLTAASGPLPARSWLSETARGPDAGASSGRSAAARLGRRIRCDWACGWSCWPARRCCAHIPRTAARMDAGRVEPDCSDIDVAALHQHYLAAAKAAGAGLLCRAEAGGRSEWPGGLGDHLADGRNLTAQVCWSTPPGPGPMYWRSAAACGPWVSPRYVGRWCRPGSRPIRRPNLPLVLDFNEQFYFKPEGGRLWISPHDEASSPPCDAAPEELDVAVTIDRFERVVDWPIAALEQRWAGLRSFAPDRLPVYGFAPDQPGFFWCLRARRLRNPDCPRRCRSGGAAGAGASAGCGRSAAL